MKNSKKLFLTLSAIGVLALSASASQNLNNQADFTPPPQERNEFIAHHHPEFKGDFMAEKHMMARPSKEEMQKRAEEFEKRLQLTDEQKEKIEKSREKSHKKMEKIIEQERKLQQEKHEIIKQNMEDFEAILTDTQKDELKKMKEEHRAKMEQKKEEFKKNKGQKKNKANK